MKVLIISGDPTLFNPASEVAKRMVEYGKFTEKLTIFLLIRVGDGKFQLSERVLVRVFSGRWSRFLKALITGRNLLNKQSYDLISAQDIEHAFLAWLLARRSHIPWQLQIHTDIFSPFFWRHSLINKLRVIVGRFLIPRADCVRVVTNRIRDSLTTNVVVLPIYVDIEKIKNTPITIDLHKKYPSYDKVILMASRLTKEKNIGLAIEAMREVVKKNPKTLLLIVGSGPECEALELQTTNYKLQTNIVFEPAVPLETLISYYKTADLYLLTSNYEGYGRTLVEAAAAGTPIITTDVGIAREIAGAKIVPVGDKDAFSRVLLKATESPLEPPRLPEQPGQEEYFARIRELWETCKITK